MHTSYTRKIIWSIIVLTLVGVATSAYLLVLHYLPGPSFCAIDAVVNCDLVNKGPYGELWGIPIALIGLLGYIASAIAGVWHLKQPSSRSLWILRLLASGGFLFSLWLLYLELFVILAICPFCMTSLLLITIVMSLVWAIPPISGAKAEPHNDEQKNKN